MGSGSNQNVDFPFSSRMISKQRNHRKKRFSATVSRIRPLSSPQILVIFIVLGEESGLPDNKPASNIKIDAR